MTRYSRIATKTTKQIDTLYERGLDITNDVDTQHKIRNIGYFKLKGYCDPFFDRKDHFKAGSSFYRQKICKHHGSHTVQPDTYCRITYTKTI